MNISSLFNFVISSKDINQIKNYLNQGNDPYALDEKSKTLGEYAAETGDVDFFEACENLLWSDKDGKIMVGNKELTSSQYAKIVLAKPEGKLVKFLFNININDYNIDSQEIPMHAYVIEYLMYSNKSNTMIEQMKKNQDLSRKIFTNIPVEYFEKISTNLRDVILSLIDEQDKDNIMAKVQANRFNIHKLFLGDFVEFDAVSNKARQIILSSKNLLKELSDRTSSIKETYENSTNVDALPFPLYRLFVHILKTGKVELIKTMIETTSEIQNQVPINRTHYDPRKRYFEHPNKFSFTLLVPSKLTDTVIKELITYENQYHMEFEDFEQYLEVKTKGIKESEKKFWKVIYTLESQNRELKYKLHEYVNSWTKAMWEKNNNDDY
ncbi:MAG TPA: hypothetical protein PLR26_05175 [Bacilli bacterium]|mgnify:CR=1 FL=1|nr:hypothetical protein [Bacilli bacterium]